jgi:hypothetical protein
MLIGDSCTKRNSGNMKSGRVRIKRRRGALRPIPGKKKINREGFAQI